MYSIPLLDPACYLQPQAPVSREHHHAHQAAHRQRMRWCLARFRALGILVVVVVVVIVVVVVVVVVLHALYVFDDPLFWLPRNRRSKKILQNTVLRKGANLKKVQSSESGFFGFFRKIMMGRHKNTVLRSVSGSACFFSKHAFQTQSHMAAKQKVL